MLKRYLIREILSNFLVALFIVLFLLFLTRIIDFGPELFQKGGTFSDLVSFSGYLLFFLLPFALPLAALTGTLLAFMRLAHDQEILAFSALGVSPRKLLIPVIYFSLVIFLIVLVLNLVFLPVAKRHMRDTLFEVFKRRLEKGLPEKTPVDWFPGLLLYAHKVKKGFHFKDFYLFEESGNQKVGFIYAEKGELRIKRGEIELRLEKGEGHFLSKDLSEAENFYFGTYIYRIPMERMIKKRKFKRGELNLGALLRKARDPKLPLRKRRKYLAEFYQRLFYPFSALILPLLGLPLGARLRASGRGLALAAGLLLYLLYYLLFSFGTTLAEGGKLPPFLALAWPNLFFLGLALFLFRDFEKREGR